jgi:hypothetical protein
MALKGVPYFILCLLACISFNRLSIRAESAVAHFHDVPVQDAIHKTVCFRDIVSWSRIKMRLFASFFMAALGFPLSDASSWSAVSTTPALRLRTDAGSNACLRR